MSEVQKLVILGSGAHAAELEGYINDNNHHNNNKQQLEIVGYYDDNKDNWSKYKLNAPYLGKLRNYEPKSGEQLMLGVANPKLRGELIEFYKEKGATFFTFIHYSSFIFPTAKIAEGNVICRNCTVGPNVVIGEYNTLNTNCNIGHDSIIGQNNVLCPNVGLSGASKLGNSNFFSINAVTIPNISIGNENVIAPNMVIEKNIKDNTTVFHRFKEKVLAIPK